jgi:hypothetical protein
MPMVRSGSCNFCGACCGAISAPQPANPWPASYPASIRLWSDAELERELPLWREMGLVRNAEGEVGYRTPHGMVTVGGVAYPYVWDGGWRKPENQECALLLPDPGDSTRPCALVGSELEHKWHAYCRDGSDGSGFPPKLMGEAQVVEWFKRHPKCSYEYVEALDGAE